MIKEAGPIARCDGVATRVLSTVCADPTAYANNIVSVAQALYPEGSAFSADAVEGNALMEEALVAHPDVTLDGGLYIVMALREVSDVCVHCNLHLTTAGLCPIGC